MLNIPGGCRKQRLAGVKPGEFPDRSKKNKRLSAIGSLDAQKSLKASPESA
jgi:hypothetical protein